MSLPILVTGGAGFVGSHICKKLAQSGYAPIVYDNLDHGHADAVRWGPLVTGNINDTGLLINTLRDHDIRTVFHCAALIDVAASVRDPASCYQVNSAGTGSLLRAMRATEADTLVFSSTCAVYGEPVSSKLAETHPRHPVNPYGRSKLAAEHQIEDATANGWLRAVILRYFNAAGADPDGEIGERHDPETHAIPLAILTGLGQRADFTLFGTDYPTPDGTAIRDYVHVADLANAHLAALGYLDQGGTSRAFNLGTGRGHSVAEIIAAVEQHIRCSLNVRTSPRRAGDVPLLVANADAARSLLNWDPVHSELTQMIRDAVGWYQANPGI